MLFTAGTASPEVDHRAAAWSSWGRRGARRVVELLHLDDVDGDMKRLRRTPSPPRHGPWPTPTTVP
jgi:hypothetical protein